MKRFTFQARSLLLAAVLAIALTACGASESVAPSASPEIDQAPASTAAGRGTTSATAYSVAEILATKSLPAESVEPAPGGAAEVAIALNGTTIAAAHAAVTVDGSVATITAPGTYRISGTLDNGQIRVDSAADGEVRLILSGASIHNDSGAAIEIAQADLAVVMLADGTENVLSDGATYVFPSTDVDEPNAALFSKADLTIAGAGALSVQGSFNDGIASKDGLVIAGGSISVTAADDGIRGKDYLVVRDGNISVTAAGDGLKSDNEEDAAKGYVAVENGTLAIDAGGDAIQAFTDVLISGGAFTLTSGGGSVARLAEDASAKGVKAGANLTIDGGRFIIDAADDALHADGTMVVNSGEFDLATADDALHADVALTVNGGSLLIPRSYEGLESAVITLNGGTIDVTASDDGINVANGVDGSGMGGRPGQEVTSYAGSTFLYVHGGDIAVNAAGDGVDVNGAVEMTAGMLVVHGPTERMNGALDYDAYFRISGGIVAAAGSAGMAQAPGTSSQQASVLIFFDAVQPAGTLVHIRNAAGETVLTFAPSKDFQSLAFSAPALVQGARYEVFLGGSAPGAEAAGLYASDAYTPGAAFQSFTVSGIVTTVGNGGNVRMRGPRP